MSCTTFERALAEGPLSSAALSHMRSCASCLESAVAFDPENLFRSLGGEGLIPSGGADTFVSEIMQQIHMRQTEKTLRPAPAGLSRPYRWSAAAALVVMTLAAALSFAPWGSGPSPSGVVAKSERIAGPTLVRPVVEEYEATGATIVELPMESSSDARVVMVFDESLPVDL